MNKKVLFLVLLLTIIFMPTVVSASTKQVSYTTHVQYVGWQDYVSDGAMAGTSGKGLRLEGIKIKLENQKYTGDIKYRTHVQDYGWQTYVKNDEMAGTSGEAKRLEAIQIKLTGEMAENYDVYYRVHAQEFGWLGWARNAESAGTEGYSYRLEGIEIKLVSKGEDFPEYGQKDAFKNKNAAKQVSYTTHVQYVGWQDYVSDGAMAGTSGKGLRLEGIKIKLENQKYTGDIKYRTHVQDYGWQTYVKNDEMAGTSGEAKRLEAIQIKLTGEMKEHYDIYYRVHAQEFGWLGWARNAESAGTAGYSYRLEGIEIKLVEKGKSFPEYGQKEAFKDKNGVTKITLNKTSTTLEEGEFEQLTYEITPSNASDKTVTWTSSDESVATVSNGEITAVSSGTAIITVKTNNNKTATCVVTVTEPYVAVTEVTLNKESTSLEVGQEETLEATVKPSNATDKTVTWESSDESVATVSNGKVTAVSVGTATITAKSNNNKTASCVVTVTEPEPVVIEVTNITLNKETTTLEEGEFEQLTYEITPSNASDKTVTWTSSDESVATVVNGKVTAVSAGTATITVRTSNNKTATCEVTVTEPVIAVTEVTLNKESTTLMVGQEETLEATVKPNNATDKTVTWESSDESAATVVNGKITAVSSGTATITAKSNNNKTGTCEVTVNDVNKIHYIGNGIEFSKPSSGKGASPANTIVLESNGHFALIDTGLANSNDLNPNHATKVINYLKNLGVEELEFILITHVHYDHLGGLSAILNNNQGITVNNVYIKPYYSHDYDDSTGTNNGNINSRKRYGNIVSMYFGSVFDCDTTCMEEETPTDYLDALDVVDELYDENRQYTSTDVGDNHMTSTIHKINANTDEVLHLGTATIKLYNTKNIGYYSACKGLDENSNSVVSYITMGTRKALIAGDLEPVTSECYAKIKKETDYNCTTSSCSIMQNIVKDIGNGNNLNVDLLELSHHGYSSCDMSTSIKNKINPGKIVIPNWEAKITYYYGKGGPYAGGESCYDKYFSGFANKNYVENNNLVYDFTNNGYTVN